MTSTNTLTSSPFLVRISALALIFFSTIVSYSQVPGVTSFTPSSGGVGTSLTISGINFSAIAGNNIVFFGAVRATVSAESSTEITVSVPTGAIFGPITVTNLDNHLTAYSAADFTPTFSPNKGSLVSSDFETNKDFKTAYNNSFQVAAADLDGDGLPDLLVSNGSIGDPLLSIFRNTSALVDVSFATPQYISMDRSAAITDLAIADIDSDGRLDIVVTSISFHSVSVLRNVSTVGAISFESHKDFATGVAFDRVVAGDLNGDGKTDLALLVLDEPGGGNKVFVMENTSSGGTISFAGEVSFAVTGSAFSMAIGDLDGDGKPELATAENGNDHWSVLRNTSASGVLSFASKVDFTYGQSAWDVSIADLDDDGAKDVAITTNSGYVSMLRNTSAIGTPSFASPVHVAVTGASAATISDLDGDSKPDVVLVRADRVSVLRNTSAAASLSFDAAVDIGTIASPYSLACGDFDGDGNIDIATTQSSLKGVSVFRNNPFHTPRTSPATLITQNSFQANWGAALGATDYLLDVSETKTFSSFVNDYENVSVGNVALYAIDIDISPGTTYYYRVRAVNSYGTTVSSNIQTVLTTPPTPVATAATEVGSSSFIANWDESVGATSYELNVSTTDDFSSFVLGYQGLDLGDIRSRLVNGLVPGTAYYYQVRAANSSGSTPYSNTISLQTLKISQTIDFGSFSDHTFGEAPLTLAADASSGLEVSYLSSNQDVATINGDELTIVGVGTSTITASQAGNGTYNAAPDVPRVLTVGKSGQTIAFNGFTPVTYGQAPITLEGTATSDLEVSYSSSNTLVATVAGNIITVVGAGTSTITASQEGDDHYKAADDVPRELTVGRASQAITFNPLEEMTLGDDDFDLVATASSLLGVSFSTSTSDKVSIAGAAVTILDAGRATINADQAGNDNFEPAPTIARSFCIKPAHPVISTTAENSSMVTLNSSSPTHNQWFLNGIEIENATNATFVATEEGIYNVQVQVDDCASDLSEDFNLIITGLVTRRQTEISIYPNPVDNSLAIIGIGAEIEHVLLYDVTGRSENLAVERENEIYYANVKHLKPGVYLLRLQERNGPRQVKFVKK